MCNQYAILNTFVNNQVSLTLNLFRMKVNCSEKIQTVVDLYTSRERPSHTFAALQQRTRRQTKNSKINGCNIQFDMVSETINGHTYYNTSVSGQHLCKN